MIDKSIFRLYKNNFEKAKINKSPLVTELWYSSFIQISPTETILVTTNQSENISFVGSIKVELVDSCNLLVQDITDYFAYLGFEDSNGIKQITFEFGKIGIDYYSKPLYLKITDLLNGNIWYSCSFNISSQRIEKTTRFDYTSNFDVEGFEYTLSPYIQSIRLSSTFFKDVEDEIKRSEYISSSGEVVNYKPISTLLNKYVCEQIDINTFRGLNAIFSHPIVYIDTELSTIKDDLKKEGILGTTNFFKANFTANPQNKFYFTDNQILPKLVVTNRYIEHLRRITATNINLNRNFVLTFNKLITFVDVKNIKLYKDGLLVYQIVPIINNYDLLINLNLYTFTNGEYSLVIEPNFIKSGVYLFEGYDLTEWSFTVANGDFSVSDFSTNDFFTT